MLERQKTSGIEGNASGTLEIYPNPATDKVHINLQEEGLRYALYQQNGRLVTKGSSSIVDVSNLSDGIYILLVYTNKAIMMEKVIITR